MDRYAGSTSLFVSDDESFNNLLSLIDKIRENLTGKNIFDICSEYDADGNGFLSHSELKSVFASTGVVINETDLDNLVSMMDTDGDNAIEYTEFTKLFGENTTSSDRAATLEEIVKSRAEKRSDENASREAQEQRKKRKQEKGENRGKKIAAKRKANEENKVALEEVTIEVEESKDEDDANDFMAALAKKTATKAKEREKLKEKLAASNHSHNEQQVKKQKQVLKKKEKGGQFKGKIPQLYVECSCQTI